jgi:aminoglycoside 3-N-acetyltransferase
MVDHGPQARMSSQYNFGELVGAYRSLNLPRGGVVYVQSAIWRVRGYVEPGADALARAHLDAIREAVGGDATIVVSTATMNLCNTELAFDLDTTPSFNRGVISELVRQQPEAHRSFHPFGSYAALGLRAAALTNDVSRHVYGPMTPEARMIDADARVVNIGLPPNIISTVHHVEQVMAVPYRYTKEFLHPVVRAGATQQEPFYMHVWYRDIGVERSHNQRLFARLLDEGRLHVHQISIGEGAACSYALAEFFEQATRLFAEDIYIWCKSKPAIRPYRS